MTAYIKLINRMVWKVVETKIEVANAEAPTPLKKCYSKTMTLLLAPFMILWIREHLSKSRTLR
jgi:hypothetical protein